MRRAAGRWLGLIDCLHRSAFLAIEDEDAITYPFKHNARGDDEVILPPNCTPQ